MNTDKIITAAKTYLGSEATATSFNGLVLQAANKYLAYDRTALPDALKDALNQYLTNDRIALTDAMYDAAIQFLAGDDDMGDAVSAAIEKYIRVGGSFTGLDLDFANNRYALNGAYSSTFPAGWSFTRASPKTAPAPNGLLSFATGVPAIVPTRGLLVEEARTNILSYSTPGTLGWALLNTTAIQNAASSPTGAIDAMRLTSSAASQARAEIGGFVNSVAYMVSAYAKLETARYVGFGHYNGTTDSYASFDLQTGTVVGASGPEFSDLAIAVLADGWFRVSAAWTSAGAGSQLKLLVSNNPALPANTGNGISSLFWGCQLEAVPAAAPGATSLIVTTGSAVTRPSDVPTQNFTPGAEGVLMVEWIEPEVLNTGFSRLIGSNGAGALAPITAFGTDRSQIASWNGAMQIGAVMPTRVVGQRYKAALCWDANGRRFVGTGGNVASDANGIGSFTQLVIGYSPVLSGFIKRVSAYNTAMTNAQLQALVA